MGTETYNSKVLVTFFFFLKKKLEFHAQSNVNNSDLLIKTFVLQLLIYIQCNFTTKHELQ